MYHIFTQITHANIQEKCTVKGTVQGIPEIREHLMKFMEKLAS